jgi:hypothetical protein
MEQSSVEKKSPIELLMTQLYKKGFLKEIDGNEPINLMNKAKEMEKERIIELIQFIVSEKELVDYSSVSKETANYYLDKFNKESNK